MNKTTAIETLIPRLWTVRFEEPPSLIKKTAPLNKLISIETIRKITKYLYIFEEKQYTD